MLAWSIIASLPLGFEAGQHGLRVHARLDELERDLAPHRPGLLGDPNRAHAAFADFFEQLVAARDDGAGLLVGDIGVRLLRAARHLLPEKTNWLLVGLEKGLYALPQLPVAGAFPVQQGGSPVGCHLGHGHEDLLDALRIDGHGKSPTAKGSILPGAIGA
jgi:hypothetical protein